MPKTGCFLFGCDFSEMSKPQFTMLDQSMSTLHAVNNNMSAEIESVFDCAQDLIEQSTANNTKEIDEMKKIMHKYIEMERELKHYQTAIKNVKEVGNTTENDEDIDYLSCLKENLEKLQTKNSEDDITKHEKYVKLSELYQQEEKKLSAQSSENMDEEIAITQQEQNTRCVITGKEMVDPVRNTVCGHSYDRKGIEHYLQTRPNGRCPVSACSNAELLQKCNLEENKELKRFIERKNRQKAKHRNNPKESILL
ncbi:E3 SUMO-protein ligase NSE2 isoform X1 [Octopus bimaculoides]|nr:E3 SUMO-protein ligase NSE2 isoform X1 [Octopus bimaculoides]|eukprot:XP_014767488.1 PREDICTED: E3 SUMO-protein ligase NSE2-like isoform X1 [Octopus bimaculoides]